MPYDNSALSLFMQHRAELMNYATSILGCRSRAEDVVQEAYLRFNDTAEQGQLTQPVGYLFRIVRNLAIDLMRRLALESSHVESQVIPDTVTVDTATPETELLRRMDLQIVREALEELPERTRIALEMYRFGDCKLKDIAQCLGISITLAHALVHAGLTHCRRRLRDRSG